MLIKRAGTLMYEENEPMYDEHGNIVCLAAKDIYAHDMLNRDQFKDWRVPVPKTVGDLIKLIAIKMPVVGDA